MSNGSGSDDQQLWVLFREAVAWIAYRSFSGDAFGPRPLRELPYDDGDDEEHNMGIGRCTLAEQILVDHAAKGKIRIYARHVEAEADHPEDYDGSLQLTVEFLTRAELAIKNGEGYILFIRGEYGRLYYNLAVNYRDLVREFWGDGAPAIEIPETTVRPEPSAVPLRRRGRRPRYPWPDFAAELVRRSISGPPIANQAALTKHMLEWCAATWGAEPAESEVREWVRPTFRMLARSSAWAVGAPNGTVDNSSPGIAEAAGE